MVPDPSDYCCTLLECDFSKPTPDPFSPTPAPTRIPDPFLHTALTPTPGDATTNSPPTGSIPTPSFRPHTIAPEFSE